MEIPLEALQAPGGIPIPRLLLEELVQRSLSVIQLPLLQVTGHQMIEVMGTHLDLGKFYLLFPPLKRRITLPEVRERLAAVPQETQLCIPCEAVPAWPRLVKAFYPWFLPPDWAEKVETELAARIARMAPPGRTVTRAVPLPSITPIEDRDRAAG